jgi:carbon-monoxide dehydrogenase small subunit
MVVKERRLAFLSMGRRSRLRRIQVKVNGTTYEHEVEPRLLLVHYLREVLNLTGTMVGCNTSNCGACTVLMDEESVKSCTLFAVQADGHEITTVQGLAENGEWHPMQTAFHETHALQCGYCTPGMIMASISLLNENPDPSEEEIREALEGNYCRCTGYENIIKAVQQAAGQTDRSAAGSESDLSADDSADEGAVARSGGGTGGEERQGSGLGRAVTGGEGRRGSRLGSALSGEGRQTAPGVPGASAAGMGRR